jgi:hypothetical protein
MPPVASSTEFTSDGVDELLLLLLLLSVVLLLRAATIAPTTTRTAKAANATGITISGFHFPAPLRLGLLEILVLSVLAGVLIGFTMVSLESSVTGADVDGAPVLGDIETGTNVVPTDAGTTDEEGLVVTLRSIGDALGEEVVTGPVDGMEKLIDKLWNAIEPTLPPCCICASNERLFSANSASSSSGRENRVRDWMLRTELAAATRVWRNKPRVETPDVAVNKSND